eukprot:CAMPEP_0203806652 /NCGR_PEP_ID=MMETSP0115-20131106/610_1 /ASSEMBLY_ACC=CAM_ASM_000227 /TAXON_ID=33651 /ORGANISM="Bicosoecid sp, Strain ms1" /LENGTH=50 /DNA_ID=CAMNT_0050715315 /DNA_START=116 /DNA_END=265 /DNA_ORIENTATION=-
MVAVRLKSGRQQARAVCGLETEVAAPNIKTFRACRAVAEVPPSAPHAACS